MEPHSNIDLWLFSGKIKPIIVLILHCTQVMWPWPHSRHWETSVWTISPVSACPVWLGSGLAYPWLPLSAVQTQPRLHACLPCTKSCDQRCLVSSSAGQNNLYCGTYYVTAVKNKTRRTSYIECFTENYKFSPTFVIWEHSIYKINVIISQLMWHYCQGRTDYLV